MRLITLGQLLLTGGAVVAYNVWKWRQDREVAAGLHAQLCQPCPAVDATPKVSILVAAWNEAHIIERHVRSVNMLSYPNREYVLCAGGTDGTYARARVCADHDAIVLEQLPGEGKQRALRRAFERSTGELVFLTDADCILDDDAFGRTIQSLVRGDELAASGDSMPLLEQFGRGVFPRYQWAAQAYSAAHAGGYLNSLLGRNAAVHRRLLLDVAAFDEDVATGTDYHLGKKIRQAGYAIRHVPDSLVRTEYPASLGQYVRQQRRWLRNVMLLGRRSRSWREVAQAAQTSAVGASMLLLPLAMPLFGGRVAWPWLAAFVHGVAARVRYAAFIGRLTGHDQFDLALLAPSFTLLEFGVWALPLMDYPSAARRWQW